MKKSLIPGTVFSPAALAAAIGLCAQLAAAEGVEMTFGLGLHSQTDSNAGLDPVNPGRSSRTGLDLSFGLSSETASTRLAFQAKAGVLAAQGPGSPASGLNDPSLGLSYLHSSADAEIGFDATLTDADLNADRTVTDFTSGNGTRRTGQVSARIAWGKTAPLGFDLTASHSDISYHNGASAGLLGSRSDQLAASLRADLSEVLRLDLGLRASQFNKDGQRARDTRALDLGLTLARPQGELGLHLGLEHTAEGQRSSLRFDHRIDLAAGSLSYALGATRGVSGKSFVTGAFGYTQELPAGTLSLSLDRAVQSGSETDTETVQSSASLGWRGALGPQTTLALSLDWAEQVDSLTDLSSTNTSLSAVWNQSLTPDWSLDLGYTRQLRHKDGQAHAESDRIFLDLRREFSIRF